jgi:hypothetical protein
MADQSQHSLLLSFKSRSSTLFFVSLFEDNE